VPPGRAVQRDGARCRPTEGRATGCSHPDRPTSRHASHLRFGRGHFPGRAQRRFLRTTARSRPRDPVRRGAAVAYLRRRRPLRFRRLQLASLDERCSFERQAGFHHEVEPQPRQLQGGAGDVRQPEELRLPVRAEVVVHRHLDELGARLLEPPHELHADDSRARVQRVGHEQRPPEQAEVAVGVTLVQPEGQLHHVVVDAADDLAVPRVAPADLVALHDVGARRHRRHHHRCLLGVVLGVAVGVEDPLLARRGERADQRAAVAAVAVVHHDDELGHLLGQRVQHVGRAVARPVVDHDDLQLVDEGRQRAAHVADHRGDGVGVVVAREAGGHRVDRRVAAHVRSSAAITVATSSSVSSGKHGSDVQDADHASASGHGWRRNAAYAGCCVSASG